MPLFEQGHALLIGVADYQDPGLKLSVPITVADATGVADALVDPAVGAYPPGQVKVLQDARATRPGVVAALEALAKTVKSTDTAFLFFCGHGVLGEDGLYYFTTQDTVLTPELKARKDTGLSAPLLVELLRKIRAQKLLFVINACFSGHVSPTLSPDTERLGAPPSATLKAEVLALGEGRAILTASRPTQPSYFSKQQTNTYFGRALIDGLRGDGSAGAGGYVGLYELYQHVHARVGAVVGALGGAQEPMLTILQGVGPFPVALHGGGAAAAKLNPAAIQQQPPPGAAVEVVPRTVVEAIGRGAQALLIQAGGNVIKQSRKVIDFGSGTIIHGNFTTGDVVGGDLIKVTVTTAAAAAGVDDKQALLGMIDRIRADVAKLTDAPKGKLEDADDELRKAREAEVDGDRARLLEKLESAQKVLLALAGSSPAALAIGEAVGTLLQRALALKG